MKSLVLIALVVILGNLAVHGYGPGGPRFGPPGHGWGRGGPGGGPHGWGRGGPGGGPHGGPHGWHHRPGWHDSDSGPNDSSGPDNSSGPDDSSGPYDSNDSDYGDHGHHTKSTSKPPTPPSTSTKEPITTTQKPTTTTSKPTTTTQKPTTTTETPTTTTEKPTTTTQKPTTTTETPTTTTEKPTTTTERPTTTTQKPTTTTPSRPTCPTVKPCDCEKTTHSIPETTPANPEPETTTSAGEITPQIQACINSCHSTPEYNPVCGSNGITYDNEGKLFCAKSCGINVTLRRRSVCPPTTDGTTTLGTPPPTITDPPPVGRTTSLSDFQRCTRLCTITPSFTPVCGTDLVTYMNIDRLKCAQKCGQDVKVLCEKPCAACGITPGTPKTTTTMRPTTTPQIGRSTLAPDVQKCIKTCPVTPEYNPVCGSDQVTYSNPSRLLCAQMCGTGVRITRMGPCGSTTTMTTTTITVAPPSTRSPAVSACIRRCPVTSEYDPVCGTDGLTYTNLGNLECSKYCGVAVDFKHKSRCIDEFDLGGDGTTEDVNGYKDQVTTTTPFPTTKPITTPKPITTTKAGPSSSTTLGFTIPDDVLNDIFGSTTTEETITKPRNPDEDEDLDLDSRYTGKKHR